MFLPDLIPDDTHLLWMDGQKNSDGLHFLRSRKKLGNNSLTRSHCQQQQLTNNATTRFYTESNFRGVQFAPPLSSYSSANVGATISAAVNNGDSYLNNSGGIVESGCGSHSSGSAFDDDIESRYAYLNSIKTFGYSYMKPLGINKTMQKMIEEEQDATNQTNNLQENDTEQNSQFADDETAENVTNNNHNQNVNNAEAPVNNATMLREEAIDVGQQEEEIDLDAEIPDLDHSDAHISINSIADDEDTDEEDEYADININDDFMAEEEEYDEYRGSEAGNSSQLNVDDITDHANNNNTGDNDIQNSNHSSNINPNDGDHNTNSNSTNHIEIGNTLGVPKIRNISTSTRISSLSSSRSFSEGAIIQSSSRNASDYYSRISNHTGSLQIHSSDIFSSINNVGSGSLTSRDIAINDNNHNSNIAKSGHIEEINGEASDMEIDD